MASRHAAEAAAAQAITQLPSSLSATAIRSRWHQCVDFWLQALEADRKSPATIRAYRNAIATWERYMDEAGRFLDPASVDRQDARGFLAYLVRQGAAPTTQVNRFVILKSFFGWMADPDEDIIKRSPFAGIKAPKALDPVVPLVTAAQLEGLLAVTSGTSFHDRRDRAMILLLASTGMRAGELIGLFVEDVDPALGVARVAGATSKGERSRDVRYGSRQTVDAVRRYLMTARPTHPDADLVEVFGSRRDNQRRGHPLWLSSGARGVRGALRIGALNGMLQRRCHEAGIDPYLHPHQFRHTWTDGQFQLGTPENEIMLAGGWSTREMLDRYGRANAANRALTNYRDPVDRLLLKRGRL